MATNEPKRLRCTCKKDDFIKKGCTCGVYPEWPGDDATMEAWNKIGKLAREHALIVSAAGGQMLLALPKNQRDAEVFLKCLYMSGFGPHPQGWEEKEAYEKEKANAG